MPLPAPLSFGPISGFVAFDGGGAVDLDPARPTPTMRLVAPPADPAATPASEGAVGPAVEAMRQSAAWEPNIGLRSRRVEGAVLVAICAYFVFGFACLAGWV